MPAACSRRRRSRTCWIPRARVSVAFFIWRSSASWARMPLESSASSRSSAPRREPKASALAALMRPRCSSSCSHWASPTRTPKTRARSGQRSLCCSSFARLRAPEPAIRSCTASITRTSSSSSSGVGTRTSTESSPRVSRFCSSVSCQSRRARAARRESGASAEDQPCRASAAPASPAVPSSPQSGTSAPPRAAQRVCSTSVALPVPPRPSPSRSSSSPARTCSERSTSLVKPTSSSTPSFTWAHTQRRTFVL
mmetsp:Transcript_33230/g.94940  ORF Transcript_33230/g.94940 Transcript_33230/m.94940 type:complete len:253 (+) Transcript_33230:5050-5808(+)